MAETKTSLHWGTSGAIMDGARRIFKKLNTLYRRLILRDQFLLEASRWLMDHGDESLRLDYPLTHDSIVFDIGGYQGDFAGAINEKYGCNVYIFEPVPAFYEMCVDRFKENKKIVCMNYGLSSHGGYLDICLSENASSFFSNADSKGGTQRVKIKSITDCIRELRVERIHLMKINIEGGEFDILPALIESDAIAGIDYLQVQFHNFVIDAAKKREEIRASLVNSHTEMWNYDFVWESWKRK